MITSFKSFVQEIPSYSQVYHDQVTEQHKQYYFYNRQHNLAKAGELNRKNFLPLNEANLKLGRFCKKAVDELYDLHDDRPLLDELRAKIKKWQDYYNEGGTFDTYEYARHLITGLQSAGVPVFEKLRNEPEVVTAFLRIPFVTKAFFQINILVQEEQLYHFLSEYFAVSIAHPSIHYYVKEMTINSSFLVASSAGHKDKFAIVKFILLPGIINSFKSPIINALIDIMHKGGGYKEVPSPLHSYSERREQNIFVSQGSTNYKKFLDLLGIIGEVYSEESHFAYIKN